MHAFSSTIQYIKLQRARRKHKQTALHLLSVSGVVRPSHVELHYSTPIAHTTAFRRQPSAIEPDTHSLPLPSWDHHTTRNVKRTGPWARSLASSVLRIANTPIVFPWTRQLDL